MLVLSRQRDESIMIGDNIVVTIVDIRGDKVRLGINAPSEIPVHRQEVYEAIQRENIQAASLAPEETRDTDSRLSEYSPQAYSVIFSQTALSRVFLAHACRDLHRCFQNQSLSPQASSTDKEISICQSG